MKLLLSMSKTGVMMLFLWTQPAVLTMYWRERSILNRIVFKVST
jgi:hypothetical protein